MISDELLNKYPVAKKFLDDHPEFTIDQAIEFVDAELKKIEK